MSVFHILEKAPRLIVIQNFSTHKLKKMKGTLNKNSRVEENELSNGNVSN